MSNAGYGNHDAPKPGSATAEPSRPGAPSSPDSTGSEKADPNKAGGPAGQDGNRNVATPGDGAGPAGPQGDEVDPGTG